MQNKLFVGSLSWDTTEETLKSHFEQVGDPTDVTVIRDRVTGRSRGFGFVTMSSEEEAQAAVDKLDGSTLDNREIKVDLARPSKDVAGNGSDE